MKKKRFKELKNKLKEKGLYPASYLAEVLNMPISTLNAKMAGKREWRGREMYQIMDLIQEPYSMVIFYFPPEELKEAI